MKHALVTIFDDNYAGYAYAMINSFVQNNSWFIGDIVCLYDDYIVKISNNTKNVISSLYKNVIFYKVDSSKYKNVINKHYNYLAKKSFLPCILKYEIFGLTQYDKILFVDADTLIISDLQELYNRNDSLAVALDWGRSLSDFEEVKHTLAFNEKFNAGVIFLSGNKYINKNVQQDIIHYSEEREGASFFEQDMLNDYFYFINRPIPYILLKYNYNFPIVDDKYYKYLIRNKECIDEMKILHFWYKPYQLSDDIYVKQLYNNYKFNG